MSTCKDCAHVEVCNSRFPDPNNERLICENFKDLSRFVELPFHIGDDVYCTRMFKIYKKTVEKIELDDDGLAIVTEDGYCFDSTICFHSQEEAEQALKERENNENQ